MTLHTISPTIHLGKIRWATSLNQNSPSSPHKSTHSISLASLNHIAQLMKPLPTGSGLCLLSRHSDCRLQCYNSATHARTRRAGRNSRERGEDAGNEDTKHTDARPVLIFWAPFCIMIVTMLLTSAVTSGSDNTFSTVLKEFVSTRGYCGLRLYSSHS